MHDPNYEKSTTSLLSQAMHHVGNLVRKEVDLARAEVNEAIHQAIAGIGMIVGAAIVFLVALHVLAAALVTGIADGFEIDVAWASLIVGGSFALIGAIMLWKGSDSLKATNLAPKRTVRNVKKDAYVVKETATHA